MLTGLNGGIRCTDQELSSVMKAASKYRSGALVKPELQAAINFWYTNVHPPVAEELSRKKDSGKGGAVGRAHTGMIKKQADNKAEDTCNNIGSTIDQLDIGPRSQSRRSHCSAHGVQERPLNDHLPSHHTSSFAGRNHRYDDSIHQVGRNDQALSPKNHRPAQCHVKASVSNHVKTIEGSMKSLSRTFTDQLGALQKAGSQVMEHFTATAPSRKHDSRKQHSRSPYDGA